VSRRWISPCGLRYQRISTSVSRTARSRSTSAAVKRWSESRTNGGGAPTIPLSREEPWRWRGKECSALRRPVRSTPRQTWLKHWQKHEVSKMEPSHETGPQRIGCVTLFLSLPCFTACKTTIEWSIDAAWPENGGVTISNAASAPTLLPLRLISAVVLQNKFTSNQLTASALVCDMYEEDSGCRIIYQQTSYASIRSAWLLHLFIGTAESTASRCSLILVEKPMTTGLPVSGWLCFWTKANALVLLAG